MLCEAASEMKLLAAARTAREGNSMIGVWLRCWGCFEASSWGARDAEMARLPAIVQGSPKGSSSVATSQLPWNSATHFNAIAMGVHASRCIEVHRGNAILEHDRLTITRRLADIAVAQRCHG
jgi:hypothetical protein